VAISVIKGTVDTRAANADWRVDGLSGATLTSRGVNNLIRFWMGERGFAPFLNNLRNGRGLIMDIKDTLFKPVFRNNPIALQILGVCSALAVTSSLKVTLVMCIALTLVVAFSNLFIAMYPNVYSGEHPDHRADDDHRLAGDRC
jgi:hypothetical protein